MTLNIKDLRTKKGLSQQELAEKTGIPKGRINNWEQGKGRPKAEDYEILKQFLNVSEIDLSQNTTDENGNAEDIYRNIVEGNTEYILIPRTVLQEKYRLVAIEQIQKDQAFLQGQAETISNLIVHIGELTKALEIQKTK